MLLGFGFRTTNIETNYRNKNNLNQLSVYKFNLQHKRNLNHIYVFATLSKFTVDCFTRLFVLLNIEVSDTMKVLVESASSNHSNIDQLLFKIILKLEQDHTVIVLENKHSRCCLVIMCSPMFSMNKITARVTRQTATVLMVLDNLL